MGEMIFSKKMERPEEDERNAFVAEIAALRDQESKEQKTAHFSEPEFNPAELGKHDLDRIVWEAVKDGTIDEPLLKLYQSEVDASEKCTRDAKQYSSRAAFLGFINNKAMEIFEKRRLGQPKQRKGRRKEPRA